MFNVLSKGDEALDERLRTFSPNHEIQFVATNDDSGGYRRHGQFVIPLRVARTSDGSVAFGALRERFREIARICQAS